jgi:hypothetical protein
VTVTGDVSLLLVVNVAATAVSAGDAVVGAAVAATVEVPPGATAVA